MKHRSVNTTLFEVLIKPCTNRPRAERLMQINGLFGLSLFLLKLKIETKNTVAK